ncbi:hypothetical protein NQ318_021835 [Aromia moschata]|uniref:Uncharacterized protein n=1 Tax=Aromia moschata TaxID=1265417 RepID=A0AAV8Z5W2_9CUCU|nr:hypothetical protein NQ318_021835 [Aromia moschata]
MFQGSDASSVIFASTPASRKHEFPGALPPSLPSLNHGTSSSPVPAPTPPNLPVPSPAPAQQPPQHPPLAIPSAAVSTVASVVTPSPTPAATIKPTQVNDFSRGPEVPTTAPPQPTIASVPQPPPMTMPSVPTSVTMPQPAAAPMAHHPPALDSSTLPGGHAMRTDSPAVATSANAAVAPSPGQYHHPSSYQPLYAPYAAAATPYASNTPTVTTTAVPPPPAVVTSSAQPPPQQPATATAAKSATPTTHVDREKQQQLVPPSPKGHSPVRESRERESYSSVSSLSRSSVTTTLSCPPPTTAVSSSLASSLSKPWSSSAAQPAPTQLSPAPPRPTPPLHTSFPAAPMFAAPLPPPVSRASPMAAPSTVPPNPNPFSAESLFQSSKYPTNQADMLRRELDSRFLASQDRTLGVAPPPYLRTEMHQHQHHHTHVHQHTTSLLPPPPASTLYPSQLQEEVRAVLKIFQSWGGVDSPFYRQNLGLPGSYPGYSPGLMHPGLTTGPTPFVPPNHLPTFQPKLVACNVLTMLRRVQPSACALLPPNAFLCPQSVTPQDPSKPKIVVRNVKDIFLKLANGTQCMLGWRGKFTITSRKNGEAKGSITAAKPSTDLLRPPTHLFSPSVHSQRSHDLSPFPPTLSAHRPPGFDQPHHPSSLFTAPPGHLGKSPFTAGSTMSPFTRYGAGPLGAPSTSPFSMSPFGAASRESHLGLSHLHHDPWRSLQRTIPNFPPAVNPLPPTLPGLTPPGPAPWTIKPDPILEQREREAREREERERERLRREREERERREREEKQRRLEQQQQEQRERERREREKRELERRELERQRERERERLLQEQRLAESAKQLQPPLIRDRSPLRNGDISEIRVKEEPRVKEEDIMARADPRYNPFLRHPGSLPPPPPGPTSMLDRSRMMPHALPPHPYHTPTTHWAPPADPFYRYGYNPLVDAMRVQEERANFFGAYGAPHHPSQLRPKDPALMHLRAGPGPGPPPSPQDERHSAYRLTQERRTAIAQAHK